MVLIYKFGRKESIFSFKIIAKIDKKVLSSHQTHRIEKKKQTGGYSRGVSILDRH
jgi:hypothetical protein